MTTRAERHEQMRREFARYYVLGVRDDVSGETKRRNGTAAAIAAGYKADNAASQASSMLRRDDVQQYIAEVEADAADGGGYDETWVVEQMIMLYERCIQASPVMIQGKPSGEWQFDARMARQLLRDMGELKGMWSKQADDTRARDAMTGAKARRDAAMKKIEDAEKNFAELEASGKLVRFNNG